MSSSVEKIASEFVAEARSAPMLFQDLAKVEQYIAETYKSRAFIELIQNADDAKASKFGIYELGDGFAACNDGVPFTPADITALCRSGSSSKRRGGKTIGYRGIGFKSVVNLSRTVYVFSGEHAFFFNRNVTNELLPGIPEVPLIRIPHIVPKSGHERATVVASQMMKNSGYSTVFIFHDLNERLSNEEFLAFDRNCLLFLNHLNEVEVSFRGTTRHILRQILSGCGDDLVKIIEGDSMDEWEILRAAPDPLTMIALKKVGDSIVPCNPEESVFHSFTPTSEFAGAFLKINGDYSTDPSRKSIDADEASERSFNNAVDVITDTILSLLSQKTIKRGLFTPFLNVTAQWQARSKLRLLPAIAKDLESRAIVRPDGSRTSVSSLRLKPEWIGYEDYERLCHSGIDALPRQLVSLYPEIMAFLAQLNLRTLSVHEAVEKVNESGISALGRAQLTSKVIKQYRFDLNDERIQTLKNAELLSTSNGPAMPRDLKSASEIERTYTENILANTESADLRYFYKKMGLLLDDPAIEHLVAPQAESVTGSVGIDGFSRQSEEIFKTEPAIKMWRSAEKNAEAFFRAMTGVKSVTDVSAANMGYDLEILLETARSVYIEVKAVAAFNENLEL